MIITASPFGPWVGTNLTADVIVVIVIIVNAPQSLQLDINIYTLVMLYSRRVGLYQYSYHQRSIPNEPQRSPLVTGRSYVLQSVKAPRRERWRERVGAVPARHFDVVSERKLDRRPALENVPVQEAVRLGRLPIDRHVLHFTTKSA